MSQEIQNKKYGEIVRTISVLATPLLSGICVFFLVALFNKIDKIDETQTLIRIELAKQNEARINNSKDIISNKKEVDRSIDELNDQARKNAQEILALWKKNND